MKIGFLITHIYLNGMFTILSGEGEEGKYQYLLICPMIHMLDQKWTQMMFGKFNVKMLLPYTV